VPERLSISALRAEAESTYEALPLILESGAAVGLRSMLMLAETDYAAVDLADTWRGRLARAVFWTW